MQPWRKVLTWRSGQQVLQAKPESIEIACFGDAKGRTARGEAARQVQSCIDLAQFAGQYINSSNVRTSVLTCTTSRSAYRRYRRYLNKNFIRQNTKSRQLVVV